MKEINLYVIEDDALEIYDKLEDEKILEYLFKLDNSYYVFIDDCACHECAFFNGKYRCSRLCEITREDSLLAFKKVDKYELLFSGKIGDEDECYRNNETKL